MADSFNIKQHDTFPNFIAILKENGVAVDLTDAVSVTLILRAETDPFGDRKTAEIFDPEAGSVLYNWIDTDTEEAGTFRAEIEVEWPAGIQTFPNNNYFSIVITPDLG